VNRPREASLAQPFTESVNRLVRDIVARWRDFIVQSGDSPRIPPATITNLESFAGYFSRAKRDATRPVNCSGNIVQVLVEDARSAGRPRRKSLTELGSPGVRSLQPRQKVTQFRTT
jgi:hypothetical protein